MTNSWRCATSSCETARSRSRRGFSSSLTHVDAVQIRGHVEIALREGRLHRLPFCGWPNHLPLVFLSHAHRHCEGWLIDLPAIRKRASRLVELQFQNRQRRMAE